MLEPDTQIAQLFLDTLLGENAQVCFQTFPDKAVGNGAAYKFGSLAEHYLWLAEKNNAGHGIFFAVNEQRDEKRGNEYVTKVRAIFVDTDGADIKPILNCGVEPLCVVQSSPKKYHVYWLVDNVALDKFSLVQKALAAKWGCDGSVNDLARVMRLPGFYHCKAKPYLVRVCRQNFPKHYDLDEFVEKLGLDITPKYDLNPVILGDKVPQGTRHKELIKVSAKFKRNGLEKGDLLAACMGWNNTHCEPPLPLAEVEKIVGWAQGKVEYRPDPEPEPVKPRRKPKLFSAKTITESSYPATKWIIDQVLPEGLTVLAGKPKLGKSWLGIQWSISVAQGGQVFGRFAANKGSVLNLSLEDSKRRLKERILAITQGHSVPELCSFAEFWPPLPDCTAYLEEWIKEATDPRLIIVDTFQKVRSRDAKYGEGVYAKDYHDASMFQTLAKKYSGLAIVLIHHERKAEGGDEFDSISGSVGITGAADTLMVFRRKNREEPVAKLIITGRDIGDRAIKLEWRDQLGVWHFNETDNRVKGLAADQVIRHIKALGGSCKVSDIMEEFGCYRMAALRMLDNLSMNGIAVKIGTRGAPVVYTLK